MKNGSVVVVIPDAVRKHPAVALALTALDMMSYNISADDPNLLGRLRGVAAKYPSMTSVSTAVKIIEEAVALAANPIKDGVMHIESQKQNEQGAVMAEVKEEGKKETPPVVEQKPVEAAPDYSANNDLHLAMFGVPVDYENPDEEDPNLKGIPPHLRALSESL
jgi:hypothetical protein